MIDPETDRLFLDPDAWADHPQRVIETLQARVARGLVIDASGAGPIPTQVAQLLLSARRTARSLGQDFRLEAASEAARRSLAVIGLSELLEGAVE